MTALLTVSEARHKLLSRLSPAGTETRDLQAGLGMVLAEEVVCAHSLPPFDASSMDGYAVRAEDLSQAHKNNPVRLKVVGEAAAGSAGDLVLGEGEAARITTGAIVPRGANAVVPVEWTGEVDPQVGKALVSSIEVARSLSEGDYVRPSGLDVHEGTTVLSRGKRLTVQDLGLLAACGCPQVVVHKRPRVAVFSTGDELRRPGERLERGTIFDANGPMIMASLESAGAEGLWLGIASDTPAAVQDVLEQSVEMGVDLIISTAGVSMGAHDYVRSVVEEEGHLDFWRVDVRPGKPLAFGEFRSTPFVGLPGNPVSSWLTFSVFIVPAVRRLCGEEPGQPLTIEADLAEPITSDGRESYLRGRVRPVGGGYLARLSGSQDSAVLSSLVRANALLIVPAGVRELIAGDSIKAWMLGPDGLPLYVPGIGNTN